MSDIFNWRKNRNRVSSVIRVSESTHGAFLEKKIMFKFSTYVEGQAMLQ